MHCNLTTGKTLLNNPVAQLGKLFNPLVTNGLSHLYHLDESTFIFRGIRGNFSFSFHFSMKFLSANRKASDGTQRFAASHLGLFCWPMSHKKDARLIWVKHQGLGILLLVIYYLLSRVKRTANKQTGTICTCTCNMHS